MATIARQSYEKEQIQYLNVLLENFELIRDYELEHQNKVILIDKDGQMLKNSKKKNAKKKSKKNPSSMTSSTSSSTTIQDHVFQCKIDCTVCGQKQSIKKRHLNHPMLNVPVCIDCNAIYESGEFIVSEEDHHEIYCR